MSEPEPLNEEEKIQTKPEKSLESLEKIYLKDKFPRNPDSNFNSLNIKAKELQEFSNLNLIQKTKDDYKKTSTNNESISNANEEFQEFQGSKIDDPSLQENYESFSLINGAKLEDEENNIEIKDEELVNQKYSTPLKKMKDKLNLLKYSLVFISLLIVSYLSYHMLNLLKMQFFYNYTGGEGEKNEMTQYYQKNTDNLVFSNIPATIIIYLFGIVMNVYHLIVHMRTILITMKFYENDYLINHKLMEKCHKARLLCLAFAIIFCIGNIFQIAMFNYSKEFETLTEESQTDNKDEIEDKKMMDSWRIFFYFLVIMAILIKVSLCFVQIILAHFLIKVKYDYSKMLFELKTNISF